MRVFEYFTNKLNKTNTDNTGNQEQHLTNALPIATITQVEMSIS